FYLLLPVLLFFLNRSWLIVPLIVLSAIVIRFDMFDAGLKMNFWSYATLAGRIDQFILGMLFARWNPGKATWWLVGGLWLYYGNFDATGGYYGKDNWAWWILLPTVEGLGFGALIRWYDARPLQGAWLKPVELAGKYSYSIYLLHLFVIRDVANYVDQHVVRLHNVFVTLPFATAFFAVMLLVGHFTYKWIEEPFCGGAGPTCCPTGPLPIRVRGEASPRPSANGWDRSRRPGMGKAERGSAAAPAAAGGETAGSGRPGSSALGRPPRWE
ncbi:MAG TPA: acyltransferase family protein, partial [Sphingomicrobium sp.]|nr:acyltransferase family protein [Sphingomicrobium sp.]